MLIVIIIIISVILITAAFVLGLRINEIYPSQLGKHFETEKQMAISHLKQEQKDYQEALKKELKDLEYKCADLQHQLYNLNNQYENAKRCNQQRLDELSKSLAAEIEQQSKSGALQVQGVIEFYQQQELQIQENFAEFQEEMAAKRQTIEEDYRKAEARQLEIIEEFKRAEEIKNNKNFYRIVLSENDTEDVRKLRKYADELHNPSALYKLIYKEYYERPFNEMIGRVITGRGSCGIYKITSLENGRCYIGQTRQTFKDRWRTHLKRGVKAEVGTQNKLYNALWEEGVENYTFEVLAECAPEELNAKEKEYIALYHADTWGYNSTGGNSQ